MQKLIYSALILAGLSTSAQASADWVRGGSFCLNSFRDILKWISDPLVLTPGLATVH